jgi:hypothetical protein
MAFTSMHQYGVYDTTNVKLVNLIKQPGVYCNVMYLLTLLDLVRYQCTLVASVTSVAVIARRQK